MLSRLLSSSSLSASSLRCSRTFLTSSASCDLREFLDIQTRSGEQPTYGRAWKAEELRNKSWEDLHKLWYVCLKEKNMLATEMLQNKSAGEQLPQPMRYKMVKLTMNRIKQVMSQRAILEEDDDVKKAMKGFIHNL